MMTSWWKKVQDRDIWKVIIKVTKDHKALQRQLEDMTCTTLQIVIPARNAVLDGQLKITILAHISKLLITNLQHT
jgi:predicted secreted protein